jgi:ribonuclease III
MFKLPEFRNSGWLVQALTHSSYVNEHPMAEHNERLEFLGDSVLKYVLTKYLYEHSGRSREGVMTIARSQAEKNATLAKVAEQLELGKQLRLSRGTDLQGGRKNSKILSGAFEAVIGAYHEDSGLEAVTAYVLKILPWMMA